jgi:phage baseplate assembly protein gpV
MTARRVLTVSDPLCQVVVFMRGNGSAQAVVTSKALAPTTVEIPAAPKGEHIIVQRLSDGCVEIMYDEAPHEPH